jgi:type I restriction enzyme S subunit
MPSPHGWCWIELQKVARLESGHTPSRKYPSYWDGGIPWIGIKDARRHHGRRIFETLQTVSQEGLDNSAARLLPAGTVCLSRTASVGYAVVMGQSMATSQDFVNWVCSEAMEPEFLMHLFIAEKESLLRFGKGTTHTTVYYPEVKAFHVCVPPKREQRAIVEAIESYFTRLDDAVATLERVQRNLKRYRASVLRAAVEGRLVPTEAELARAEGRDYEPASTLAARVDRPARPARFGARSSDVIVGHGALAVGNPGTPLPEGWMWAQLVDVARLETGHTPSRNHPEWWGGDVPWIGIKDARAHHGGVIHETIQHTNQDGLANSAARLLPAGTVCLSRTASVGYVVVMGKPMATSQDFVNWVCTEAIDPHWLRHVLLADRKSLLRFGKGTTHTTIYFAEVISLHLAVPPLAEQQRIVTALDQLASHADALDEIVEINHTRLARSRQSILKWAFEGRLVDQDPADEPASRLLERIQAEHASTNGNPRRSTLPRAGSPKT